MRRMEVDDFIYAVNVNHLYGRKGRKAEEAEEAKEAEEAEGKWINTWQSQTAFT